MSIFDIHNTFLELWDYKMSYLEFFGVISGVVAVTLSAFAHIWNWPLGLVNIVLSFFLFYQVQLYPDMTLQIFYFVMNLVGWWRWTHPQPGEEDRKKELKVSFMSAKELIVLIAIGLSGTILLGSFAKNVHDYFPAIFQKPSAFPYLDSFLTVMSVVTTFYVVRKKIESWIVWIVVDGIATYLYFIRDIRFYSLMYFIFCVIAAFGLWNWIRVYRTYSR